MSRPTSTAVVQAAGPDAAKRASHRGLGAGSGNARRPLVGLPTGTIAGLIHEQTGLPCAYSAAVLQAGGTPVLVPLLADPGFLEDLTARLDALLLCGGGDVHPMRYGANDSGRNTGVDPARDEVEIALTRRCLDVGRPILGICRGTQVLNVAAGGTLIQDIAATPGGWLDHPRPPAVKPSALRHSVSVTPGSLAAISLGFEPSGDDRPTIRVNSSHHQAVGDLAPGFVASAWAEDGIIEAIEARAMPGFALGVQWHPEHLLYIEAMARLFVAFVNAARDRAQEA